MTRAHRRPPTPSRLHLAHADLCSLPLPASLPAVSYDGGLKAWDADSLEIVVDRSSAHGGERVHCLAVGPDGLLYTGGDDKVGRQDGRFCLGDVGC